jgi:hypothetical protein
MSFWGEPRWLTPEEIAKQDEEARLEREESLRRWPMSQRRPRCYACGAFMPQVHYEHTPCKACGQSYLDLQ